MAANLLKFDSLKIATTVTMALGILLIIALGFLGRNVLMAIHKRNAVSAPSSSFASVRQETEGLKKYEILLQKNPFGISAGSLKDNSSGAEQTGSATSANMILTGTISGNSRDSYAVFTGGDGKQSIFRSGGTITGLGELRSGEKYAALIKQKGKVTKISMVDVNAPITQQISKGTDAASGPEQLSGKGDFLIDQKSLQSAMANPTQIMMDARLFPNLVKDRQEGFILREIRKDGFYDHLGLQNGDVLLQVNGSSISSPENALQAFMALKGMDRVKLDIIRNSNRLTLNYQIR